MAWSKAKKRAHNRVWMRRKRAGKFSRKYVHLRGWNNLFKAVRP